MTTSNHSLHTAPAGILARLDALSRPLADFLQTWRYGLIALVALAQAGVLVHMIVGRERLIAHGRQIDLKVVPVDPRDFFRGDYVILNYDISRLPENVLQNKGSLKRGDRINVRLQKTDGIWQAVEAATTTLTAGPDDVLLVGRVTYASIGGTARSGSVGVAYGIEKFFVPEGTGRDIERDISGKKVIAHVVVAADGAAAIRALTVDDRRIDIEPLF